MRKHRIIATLTIALVLPIYAQAHDDATDRAVEYRQGLMEVLGWNMKAMAAMLKGKQPFDQATFARRARDLNAAAHLDMLAGFPEDSVSDESDAKDEIWLDWENFTAKLDALRTKSEALAAAAAKGEKGALGGALSDVGKACKSCHKAYRR